MPLVLGKRGRESLTRTAATLELLREARTGNATREMILLYNMVDLMDSIELPPHYFTVVIDEESLKVLVDSKSTRTLLGTERIEIARRLNLPIRKKVTRIRTANGQIAKVREKVEISFSLKGRIRTITVCLLPDLAVSCLVGMDFLQKFSVIVDYNTPEWNFKDNLTVRYSFEPHEEPRICCGINAFSERTFRVIFKG